MTSFIVKVYVITSNHPTELRRLSSLDRSMAMEFNQYRKYLTIFFFIQYSYLLVMRELSFENKKAQH